MPDDPKVVYYWSGTTIKQKWWERAIIRFLYKHSLGCRTWLEFDRITRQKRFNRIWELEHVLFSEPSYTKVKECPKD